MFLVCLEQHRILQCRGSVHGIFVIGTKLFALNWPKWSIIPVKQAGKWNIVEMNEHSFATRLESILNIFRPTPNKDAWHSSSTCRPGIILGPKTTFLRMPFAPVSFFIAAGARSGAEIGWRPPVPGIWRPSLVGWRPLQA